MSAPVRRSCLAVVVVASLAACSSPTPSATLTLVFGATADGGTGNPLSVPPKAERLVVQAYDFSGDGGAQTVSNTALPASSIDLGNFDPNATEAIAVTGYDGNNHAVVFGATLPVQLGALDGTTLPVFVQRTGATAAMPGPLSDSRQSPLLGILNGQFLFVGGADTSSILYDFLGYGAMANPALPIVPQSLALPPCRSPASGGICLVAWLIGATTPGVFAGYYFDFSSGAHTGFTLPSGGGGFADLAGGGTVADATGKMYIVGGTRAGSPSNRVLAVDTNNTSDSAYPKGYPSWLSTAVPRQGAAAVWVDGFGLFVAGGSAQAPGFEVVAGSALSCKPQPDAMATTGAGAAVLADGRHVLLAGGLTSSGQDPGVNAVDLQTCAVTAWTSLPVALGSAQVFDIDASTAVVVGNDAASGATHMFRVSPTGASEVPMVVTHANAKAVASPPSTIRPGSIVVFGGANTLESFVP